MLLLRLVILLTIPSIAESGRCSYTGYQHYTTSCGLFGWDRCHRYRAVTRYHCCTDYVNPPNCNTPLCFGSRSCNNGGTCSRPNHCNCVIGFYSPRCYRCTAISNCDQESCSNSNDQICVTCNGKYGTTLYASAYLPSADKRTCVQQCSWRSNSNACYPGSCTLAGVTSCQCHQGFDGKDCRNIQNAPTLDEHHAIIRQGETTWESPPPLLPAATTTFINVRDFNEVEIDLTTIFDWSPSENPAPPPHSYLNAIIGIVRVSTTLTFQNVSSTVENEDFDPTREGIVEWQKILNVPTPTLTSNHRLKVAVTSTNGGVMTVYNRDSFYAASRRNYLGKTETRISYFRFDFEPPYHCVQQDNDCLITMLNAVPHISTQDGIIDVSWNNWLDDVSGISKYTLQVWKLSPFGDTLQETLTGGAGYQQTSPSPHTVSLNGNGTGVYSFILITEDNAENTRLSRRFVFHDEGTEVTISPASMRVTTASMATNYIWITTISESGPTSINMEWTNHFSNYDHNRMGLLRLIADHEEIPPGYDQTFGKRGKAAVPNALGITAFRVNYTVDISSGGRNANHPSVWTDTGVTTQVTFPIELEDGNAILFWVWAQDIVGHTREDSLLVHVDSSAPIISYLWLERDGEVNLTVHNSEDFKKMTAKFEAYDEHSGLQTIHWNLVDHTNSSIVHGDGNLPRMIDNGPCDENRCICIPQGDCYKSIFSINFDSSIDGHHDHDYYLTVTVTNNAKLTSSKTIKISIDTSAPVAGVVHDGMPGSPEVDFQQDVYLSAYCNGFFDKESGIKFYEYLFGTDCFDGDHHALQNKRRTLLPNVPVEWTAPGPGLYYVTVIAYNRALEASDPVCSDGVTIDNTSPEITSIDIERVRVKPGLVMDSRTGEIWFVGSDRKRCKLESPDSISSCPSQPSSIHHMSLFPEQPGLNNSLCTNTNMHNCDILGTANFLPVDKHIVVTWNGWDDESMIADFEVGLSSNPNNAIPDLARYSTQGHTHYIMYHPELTQGMEVYLMLKATNKAQLTTTKMIGPIIIDTTPPDVNGHATLQVIGKVLVANFRNQDVSDAEDSDLSFQIAVGHHEQSTDVLAYNDIKLFEISQDNENTWVSIPLDELDWSIHGDHTYYASIRVENSAGLWSVLTSLPYRHIVQLPSKGVVLDAEIIEDEDPSVPFGESRDVDVQMSTGYLVTRWYGFQHPHLNISYKIAIGSEPGGSDITEGYVEVVEDLFYEKYGLDLTPLKTYYSTIIAETNAGSVNVSSDGVTILPLESISEGFQVFDGPLCDESPSGPRSQTTHHEKIYVPSCKHDIEFQASTSVVETHWIIPDNLKPYVTHVYLSLEEEVYDANANGTFTTWAVAQDIVDLGLATSYRQNSFLQEGGHYRSVITLCHTVVCFESQETNGFWIISSPPSTGMVQIQSVKAEEGVTYLNVSFQAFSHQFLVGRPESQDSINYQWALLDEISRYDNRLITNWQEVREEELVLSGEMMQFQAFFEGHLPSSTCLQLALRGYNEAGLFSTAFTEIFDCDDPEQILPNIVIDVDHDIVLPENEQWFEPDVDYSSSVTRIFAVWPTLKYGLYEWAVIEDNSAYAFRRENQAPREPCEHPTVIRCGSTDLNYVNINDLTLHHGMRYKVCLHAKATSITFEEWTQTLPEVSSCSDGVVVDITPPSASRVWIGWNQHRQYQVSTTELVINWDSFIDVEEHGRARHHSGIKKYEIAIGSFPGGRDVKSFEIVGISNSAILHNIRLHNGHRYYAVVKATDFVGLSSYAVSEPVTIDNTPPDKTNRGFDIGGSFLKSSSGIIANWNNAFVDLESGIAFYQWAIGSNPGHSDVMPFEKTERDKGTSELTQNLSLQEGHLYYIAVKATNRAGLTTLQSFGAYLFDSSQPITGHVYDGNPDFASINRKDQDFQTDTTTLYASWEGFHDPHSSLVGYWWTIGTCAACDDVLPEQYVGLDTSASARYLHLVSGLVYFVTVRSCNAAELCSSVTSDGILIDETPPSVGRVYDGPPGQDTNFQASSVYLAAHWWGFHDSQSGLSHYEWRAGTQKGGSDVMTEARLHLTDSALNILDAEMPNRTDIYITVRAYNRAGLWSERTSNGFQIDSTPPDVVKLPMMDTTKGVINNHTQVMRSLITLSWKFNDSDSGIVAHYLTVFSNHNDDIEIPPTKISGDAVDYTFTNLELHDGSKYTVGVMACNGAGLCTKLHTYTFQMDSSKPSTGFFAIQSEHAAKLIHREIDGFMNWDEGDGASSLSLAWLGFSDIHSGISHYFLTIGSDFNGGDLHQDDLVRVDHNEAGTYTEEGPIQRTTIQLQSSLADFQNIYATLWAVNGVGLESNRAIAAFEVLPNGILLLVRRCVTYSCDGHCVCASQDKLCDRIRDIGCILPYEGETTITVSDVLNLQFDTAEDIDYSPSRCVMAAVWHKSTQGQDTVKWYEWSVGYNTSTTSTEDVPEGVFDKTTERVWFDAGLEERAVLSLPRGKELEEYSTYAFFVRAWFNKTTFVVFRSDGVKPDITPPQIARKGGARVKDVISVGEEKDIDITTNPNAISVSWRNVFRDTRSLIDYFEVAIGTLPEGEDTRKFSNHRISGVSTNIAFTNLNLEIGKRYFCSVRAYNMAGLHSIQSSDGFVVDTIAPSVGTVYDGTGLLDLEYTNSTMMVSASWHGFVDFESYIYRYDWCVGSTNASDEFHVLGCTSVGLQTLALKKLTTPLRNGLRYYSKIIATDSAGLSSEVAVSDGVVVDHTAPQPMKVLNFSTNLLQNPSFEMDNTPLTHWNISLNTKAQVANAGKDFAQEGLQMVMIFGSIYQTILTRIGQTYRISFYVSHVTASRHPLRNQEGRIQAPGLDEVFSLYNRPAHAHSSDEQSVVWLRHTFYFTADNEKSTITLSSLGRSNGLLLDNVQVQAIHFVDSNDISVDIDVQFVLNWASVEAKWQFVDPESPIVEYRWAIGYVKGGTQLQNFKSVGTRPHAINSDLFLTHGSKVTVTVMATNAARLVSLSYSKALTIDLTPPIIHYVNDGSHQNDADHISDRNFSISWSSADEESNIQYCEFAVGLSPGAGDIHPITQHLSSMAEIQLQLSDNSSDGQMVYTTVRCFNGAMLSTTYISDGVIIVTQPPKAEYASVTIKTPGDTQYPPQDMYQSETSRVRAYWNGFIDPVGIAFYECSLLGLSSPYNNWTQCGSSSEHHVTLDRLTLDTGANYSLHVRAVNEIGLRSDSVQGTVFIESSKPELTGDNILITWMESNKILIAWNNVFASTSQLIYEISIGTLEGGSDVLQWVETLETQLEASPLHQSTDYYITLTAINAAGLYKTVQHKIIG